MKLARLGEPGQEIPVLIDGEKYFDLRGIATDFGDLAAIEAIRAARASGNLPELDGAEALRIGAPVVKPGAILCIGMNYAAHAAESGSAPPTLPILFLKTPNTVGGPNDD
ncbi:MAG: 2,4-didehydro-3-deoxy-L-rhamnonate hydrolase, partial [Subtercola sp.]|nr:2,4-didehydro-3-deoxy-L-rhamnonate hydrolase [Subtercola sp.]